MNFIEAVKAAKNNKKVYRKGCVRSEYKVMAGAFGRICEDSESLSFSCETLVSDILANDWLVMGMPFEEALTELKNGQKIRNKNWNQDEYLCKDTSNDGDILDEHGECIDSIATDHLLSDNWELL